MDDDDYYLDRYDCPPSEPSEATRDRTGGSASGANISQPVGHLDEETLLLDSPDNSLITHQPHDASGVDVIDGEFQDDYDHLYVDEVGAEMYLSEIWEQLGVGQNGYLNLEELFRVCEHIGMSASEDMIEQLFDKLDNDQDGRLSFNELVNGLFKYVHKTSTTTTTTNTNRPSTTPTQSFTSTMSPSSESAFYHQPHTSFPDTIFDDHNGNKLDVIETDDDNSRIDSTEASSTTTNVPTSSTTPTSTMSTTTMTGANHVGDYSHFITIPTDKDG